MSTSTFVPGPTDELKLFLDDPGQVFQVPRIDPLSASPAVVLGISGVDYLLGRLQTNRRLQRVKTLVLLVPHEKTTGADQETLGRSLRRVAEARIEQLRFELRNTYRYGWRVTGLALILLAVCLALASLFASDLTEGMRPLPRKTLEYGFEIVGWVMLWNPVDVLVFTPLSMRARLRALEALAGMQVVLREAAHPAVRRD